MSARKIEYRAMKFEVVHAQSWQHNERTNHEVTLLLGTVIDDSVHELTRDILWEEAATKLYDPGQIVLFIPEDLNQNANSSRRFRRVVSLCDVRRARWSLERKSWHPETRQEKQYDVLVWSFWTEFVASWQFPDLEIRELAEA